MSPAGLKVCAAKPANADVVVGPVAECLQISTKPVMANWFVNLSTNGVVSLPAMTLIAAVRVPRLTTPRLEAPAGDGGGGVSCSTLINWKLKNVACACAGRRAKGSSMIVCGPAVTSNGAGQPVLLVAPAGVGGTKTSTNAGPPETLNR